MDMSVKRTITLYKVPAHAGVKGNEHADHLAGIAVTNQQAIARDTLGEFLTEILHTEDRRAKIKQLRELSHRKERKVMPNPIERADLKQEQIVTRVTSPDGECDRVPSKSPNEIASHSPC